MPFASCVAKLPEGALLPGLRCNVHQGEKSQVIFIEALEDVTVPPHTHAEEWGVIVSGEIEMTIDGRKETRRAGMEHHIPGGVVHSFSWKKGARAVLFFDERQRVKLK